MFVHISASLRIKEPSKSFEHQQNRPERKLTEVFIAFDWANNLNRNGMFCNQFEIQNEKKNFIQFEKCSVFNTYREWFWLSESECPFQQSISVCLFRHPESWNLFCVEHHLTIFSEFQVYLWYSANSYSENIFDASQ